MSDPGRKCPRLTEKERFYQKILKDAAERGVPLAQLAVVHDVAPATLSWWRSEIRRRTALRRGKRVKRKASPDVDEVEFVAVDLASEPPSVEEGSSAAADFFEVTLPGGSTVRVPPRFDEEAVTRLVRAVRAAC